MSSRIEIWQLRAQFASGLSQMYGAEVPAYHTLVEVSSEVNRAHTGELRLGSLERVTAERHGAIRVGSPAELAQVATLFSAFGMYPVGFYDLREAASPIPVVSTAFRPVEPDELARNPFRVFTSMLTAADVLIVTPYNAQVVLLRRLLDAAGLSDVQAGTVDKFQGRQAPVVFVSLVASSIAEVPRGISFLLNRNRLNVAVSRAKYAAVVVHSALLTDYLPATPGGLVELGAFLAMCGKPTT